MAFCYDDITETPDESVSTDLSDGIDPHEPACINAICHLFWHKTKSITDNGVAILDIILDLVLQPREKEKVITIPHILPDDMPSQFVNYFSEELDPHLAALAIMSEVRQNRKKEIEKIKEKMCLAASNQDIMAAIDRLQSIGYVHVYLVNGINYVFIPEHHH